jgi:hypothetical protein
MRRNRRILWGRSAGRVGGVDGVASVGGLGGVAGGGGARRDRGTLQAHATIEP